MTTADTLLIFRIAGIPCAVAAESVGSIVMPPAHLTHPPGSSKSTPGIFHHAEFTYSVLDLHARFGIEEPRKGVGRLLLQDEGVRHFAFLVDEVVGLVRSDEGKWANLPPYLPHSVFWSGFLYRKEIVLCTELGALRTMHDAEPLRRHIEALRQQAELSRAQTAEAETAEPAGETQKPQPRHSETTQATHSATAAAPSPQEKLEKGLTRTVRPVNPAMGHGTPETSARAAKGKPATDTREAARPTPPAEAGETAHVTPPSPPVETPPAGAKEAPPFTPSTVAKERPKQVAPPRHETAPTVHHETPPTAVDTVSEPVAATPPPNPPTDERSSLLPLMLLILLVLITLPLGYWLWFQPEQETTYITFSNGAAPDNRMTEKADEAHTPAPVADTAMTTTDETPNPPAATKPQADNTESSPEPASPPPVPLSIERDEKGTINLIIDRRAIANSTAPVPLLSTPGTLETAAADTADASPPPDGTEAAVAGAATQPRVVENEEAPLKPGPDWPAPSNPTGLEPCDCTHIVVPGDTLWDIAEKYTGNAFNYPDLARRSGIRNPDRIYPGDTVRIIIR